MLSMKNLAMFFLNFFCIFFPQPGMKYFDSAKEWVNTILYVGVFYLACTIIFVEGYQIPSGSMEPTFHGDPNFFTGDRIFALKGISHFLPLKRGDIVIFISAEDQKTFIVKRLIGFPGEKIQIKDNKIFVNDKPLTEAPFNNIEYYIPDFQEKSEGNFIYKPTWVYSKHSTSMSRNGLSMIPPIMKIKTEYSEYFTEKPLRCFAQTPYIVPKDCYFVLGDNSASSNDGRYWGPLHKRNFLGKAIMIWWPIKRGCILR